MTTITVGSAIREASMRFQAGDFVAAESICRRALLQAPAHPHALHLLGHVFRTGGRLSEAEQMFRQACEADPLDANLHSSFGGLLGERGQMTDAETHLRKAASLNPASPVFGANLAAFLERTGRFDEAAAAFSAVVASHPTHAIAWRGAGRSALLAGRVTESIAAFNQAMHLRPDDSALASERLYALHYTQEHDPTVLFAEHRRWAQRFADPLTRQCEIIRPRARSRDRRLRVGYLSCHFHEHPRARFMTPVLASHDRDRVEVFCYSGGAIADSATLRLRSIIEHWREVRTLDDNAVANLIRQDEIDVLVDSTGHMEGSRLMVLARRAAPVQVLYPGYPSTTGMAAVDACITDEDRDPVGAEQWYTERLLRLPGSAQIYEAGDAPDVGPPPVERSGFVTFGCLNSVAKFNKEAVIAWANLLTTVRGSRLILLGGPRAEPVGWVLKVMTDRGVDTSRIQWRRRESRLSYLRYYHDIDIGLDTYPYVGHTTTLDAAWMGVPTVTRYGPSHLTREGYAINRQLGLIDLIHETFDEYVQCAVALASNPSQIRLLRAFMRPTMKSGALCNASKLVRSLENAFDALASASSTLNT